MIKIIHAITKKLLAVVLMISMISGLLSASSFAVTGDQSGDIYYTIQSNDTLAFDMKKFNDACIDVTGKDLDYIQINRPDKNKAHIYYHYDKDEDADEQTGMDPVKKYYIGNLPKLSELTFVPNKNYTGMLAITYTGYNIEGKSYSGEIKITVNKATSNSIVYFIGDNQYVKFDEGDFADVCEDMQNQDLDYVKFTLPDEAQGSLYYDDKDDEDHHKEKVTASNKYYYDEYLYLSSVLFKPHYDFKGSVTINYTGYDTKRKSYQGTIVITIGSDNRAGDTIAYTSEMNTATIFKGEDFNNRCSTLMNNRLSYVKFTPPSPSAGTLYTGYVSRNNYSSIISKATSKYYFRISPYLKDVAFVPADNFTGTVTIPYTGYDTTGKSYAGKVQITISSLETSPSVSFPMHD